MQAHAKSKRIIVLLFATMLCASKGTLQAMARLSGSMQPDQKTHNAIERKIRLELLPTLRSLTQTPPIKQLILMLQSINQDAKIYRPKKLISSSAKDTSKQLTLLQDAVFKLYGNFQAEVYSDALIDLELAIKKAKLLLNRKQRMDKQIKFFKSNLPNVLKKNYAIMKKMLEDLDPTINPSAKDFEQNAAITSRAKELQKLFGSDAVEKKIIQFKEAVTNRLDRPLPNISSLQETIKNFFDIVNDPAFSSEAPNYNQAVQQVVQYAETLQNMLFPEAVHSRLAQQIQPTLRTRKALLSALEEAQQKMERLKIKDLKGQNVAEKIDEQKKVIAEIEEEIEDQNTLLIEQEKKSQQVREYESLQKQIIEQKQQQESLLNQGISSEITKVQDALRSLAEPYSTIFATKLLKIIYQLRQMQSEAITTSFPLEAIQNTISIATNYLEFINLYRETAENLKIIRTERPDLMVDHRLADIEMYEKTLENLKNNMLQTSIIPTNDNASMMLALKNKIIPINKQAELLKRTYQAALGQPGAFENFVNPIISNIIDTAIGPRQQQFQQMLEQWKEPILQRFDETKSTVKALSGDTVQAYRDALQEVQDAKDALEERIRELPAPRTREQEGELLTLTYNIQRARQAADAIKNTIPSELAQNILDTFLSGINQAQQAKRSFEKNISDVQQTAQQAQKFITSPDLPSQVQQTATKAGLGITAGFAGAAAAFGAIAAASALVVIKLPTITQSLFSTASQYLGMLAQNLRR